MPIGVPKNFGIPRLTDSYWAGVHFFSFCFDPIVGRTRYVCLCVGLLVCVHGQQIAEGNNSWQSWLGEADPVVEIHYFRTTGTII